MRKLVILTVIACTVPVALAAPSPEQKCASAKLKATHKLATSALACSKAILAGGSVDSLCLSKADEKFTAAFNKAEMKYECLTTDDATTIKSIVDAYVDDVTTALVTATPETPKSFAADVQPIFTASCALSGCHQGPSPAQGLDLSTGNAYASLVNVSSTQQVDIKRVLPGDADSSYLYQKIADIAGITGSLMPKGSKQLPNSKIVTIKAWINQSAANN